MSELTRDRLDELKNRLQQISATCPIRTHLYQVIRSCIMDGVLREDHAIREAEMAKTLGVSRTPVREALHRLEADGWLVRLRGRGLVVSGVSRKDISDLYAIRRVLEVLAVQIGVPASKNHENTLKRLEWLITEMEVHTRRGDPEAVSSKNREFHQLVTSLASSRQLTAVLKTVYDRLDRVRDGGLWARGRLNQAYAEHVAIFEAIVAGNTQKACDCVERHIAEAAASVLEKMLREEQESNGS